MSSKSFERDLLVCQLKRFAYSLRTSFNTLRGENPYSTLGSSVVLSKKSLKVPQKTILYWPGNSLEYFKRVCKFCSELLLSRGIGIESGAPQDSRLSNSGVPKGIKKLQVHVLNYTT